MVMLVSSLRHRLPTYRPDTAWFVPGWVQGARVVPDRLPLRHGRGQREQAEQTVEQQHGPQPAGGGDREAGSTVGRAGERSEHDHQGDPLPSPLRFSARKISGSISADAKSAGETGPYRAI
jgi:hypothetical protein